jgi:hypothetical protein
LGSEKLPLGSIALDNLMDGATSEDLTKSLGAFAGVDMEFMRSREIVVPRLEPWTSLHPVEVDFFGGTYYPDLLQ